MAKGKKEYPIINIHGTDFEVDVQQNLIRQKDNPNNRIGFGLMEYRGSGYVLLYDMAKKIFGGFDSHPKDLVLVPIPQMVDIDPEAMAKRHNRTVADIKGLSDLEVINGVTNLQNRIDKGKLPVIDIAGKQYFVDIRLQELRLTSDVLTKIDLRNAYNEDREEYEFYFRPAKNQVVGIDKNFKGPLNDIVLVRLPTDTILDPVAVARSNDLDVKAFLAKYPIPKKLKAEIIPAEKTDLKKLVQSNKNSTKPLLKKSKYRNNPLLKKKNQSGKNTKGKSL